MKRRILCSLLVVSAAALLAFNVGAHKGNTGGAGPTIPEDWRGAWEVTVSYSDSATGALVATDVTTAAICPGEPVMPPLLSTLLRCSGEATENRLDLTCSAKHSPRPGCNIFVEAQLNSQREGDNWNGVGSWNARIVGNCEHTNFGQDFVVTGRRVSGEAACDGPMTSLIHRFFAHSQLIPVL